MSGVLQLVTRLPNISGLPRDVTENVLNVRFLASDPTQNDIDNCMLALDHFWLADPGAQLRVITAYISDVVSRANNACSIFAYYTNDFTGATDFGSPVGQRNFTAAAAANAGELPEEVAVVLSYHGDLTDVPVSSPNPNPPPATIRPQQRRRGRMYLGPLCSIAGADVANEFRPRQEFGDDLGIAFAAMCDDIDANTAGELGVWSKADGVVYKAQGGWVDNAWDTQRRRGLDATIRWGFTI